MKRTESYSREKERERLGMVGIRERKGVFDLGISCSIIHGGAEWGEAAVTSQRRATGNDVGVSGVSVATATSSDEIRGAAFSSTIFDNREK